MSYLEQKRNIEESKTKIENNSLQPYEENFLTTVPRSLDEVKKKGLEFLYSDIVEKDIKYEFKSSLGNAQYISANNEASECLELALKARELFPRKIPDWTEHSQKCFDHLIIKYISDGLKEKVANQKGKDYETDIYIHLENKDDDSNKKIGLLFRLIYNHRSSFKHVHYTDGNGYKRIKQIRNKDLIKAKNEIIDYYKESLNIFLPIYKNIFSTNVGAAS